MRVRAPRRATVYFEPDLHKALRVKAASTDQSISDLVNDAVRAVLAEDAEDLAAFDERKNEVAIPLEDFLKDLKKRGKL